MSFDKLVAELAQAETAQETLRKALPAENGTDDDTIQAAAGEGGEGGVEGGGDADNKGGKKDGDVDDKPPMAKSITVTLEDGRVVEAEDGTELVKSLTARLGVAEDALTKGVTSLLGMVAKQGEMIKSLGDQVTKLRGEGRGRKAVVSLAEKTAQPLAKSEQQGITANEFMAKALSAMKEGRLSSMDVAVAESHLNRGETVPVSIVQRVLQPQ